MDTHFTLLPRGSRSASFPRPPHAAYQPWAQGLLQTQQDNAIAALPRPADAEPLLLYNGAENGDFEAVKSGLAQGYCPNCESELHPKFGTSPLMEGE